MKYKKLLLFIFGGLAIVFLIAFFVRSHSVSIAAFENVSVGMTEAQVKGILGIPQKVRHDGRGTPVFFYGGFQQLRWCTVEVYFGIDDRVTGKFHDH